MEKCQISFLYNDPCDGPIVYYESRKDSGHQCCKHIIWDGNERYILETDDKQKFQKYNKEIRK